MGIILSWLVLSAAVYITANTLSGFHVKNFKSAILVAALVGILSALLAPLLFGALTLLTLGLAYLLKFLTQWIIMGLILMLVDKLTDHLTIDSFGWAVGGAMMMSGIATVGAWLLAMVF